MSFWSKIFGGGIVGSIERIATECIETEKESAEAKALFVKTLDPNGIMRRELSRFACIAYGWFLLVMKQLSIGVNVVHESCRKATMFFALTLT